jgi:predicted secreted Zn-dependent protease
VRAILLSLSLLLLFQGAAAARSRQIVHPRPGLTVSRSSAYYSIRGRTAADLRRQMNSLGPGDGNSGKRYDAYSDWNLSWWYRDRVSRGKCRITGASVRVELKFTYPRWLRPAGASSALVSRWKRYLNALHRHENGHGAIAVRQGGKLLTSIRALAPRSSCRKLEAAADLLGANTLQRTNKLERAYDYRTNHGATQGARFP